MFSFTFVNGSFKNVIEWGLLKIFSVAWIHTRRLKITNSLTWECGPLQKKDPPGRLTDVGLAMGKILPVFTTCSCEHQTSSFPRLKGWKFFCFRSENQLQGSLMGAVFPRGSSTDDREDAVSENPLLSVSLRDLQGPDTLLHLKNTVRDVVSPSIQPLYQNYHQAFSQRRSVPMHVHSFCNICSNGLYIWMCF